MSERLIIKNFGPIKSIDLDLRKVNVLIGEQASGKSTVAKVLAVCRYFSNLVNFIEFHEGLASWGIVGFLNKESYISYSNSNYTFTFKQDIESLDAMYDDKGNYINFHYVEVKTPQFQLLIDEYNKLDFLANTKDNGQVKNIHNSIPPSFYQNYVSEILDNPFYLPTERGLQSIFSLGKSSIHNISDSLFNQFAYLDSISRNFNNETNIDPLKISYINENGFGKVKGLNDNDFIKLSQAASGYQSTIPLVLLIKYYSEIRKKAKHFFIEEPELNLFPKAQKALMEFLVEQVNAYNHALLLTTHSPYILTSLDNLMFAHKVGNLAEGKYADEVQEIVPKSAWMDVEEVSVYCMKNGGAVSILDRKEVLIDKDYLDEVSDIIGHRFDKLLDIEIKHENSFK